MTAWTLIRRSLVFHARAHLGALLGAAVGSAVLIGALVVGDSVRGSLRDMALERLGRVQLALAANDRFPRADLADALGHKGVIDGPVVPVIDLAGTAATADESARANRVQVLGVDDRFWWLCPGQPSFHSPSAGEVVLNQPLSAQLRVRAGDIVVLRVARPGRLSREAPISPQEDASISMRVKVAAVAGDGELGRFSLQSSQAAPFNAFVSLQSLQDLLGLHGRANVFLANVDADAWAAVQANIALRRTWTLADAELELRALPESQALELRSSRVFLDPPVARAALTAGKQATGILTYFVNELRAGNHAAPYSMVTAAGPPLVPPDLREDEILINAWLAEDLGVGPGDRLSLSYYGIGLSRRLEERSRSFVVRAVVPMEGPAADRGLMPDFPGLEKAESTRDWDASLPIRLDRIRPKDEDYWKRYRGTPKAFVSLAAGQKMWANRFGDLTAVRYPVPANAGGQTDAYRSEVEAAILKALDPAALGLRFDPVAAQAQAASEQAQDFGGLFLGFSFFLIVAALLLMALLFQFGVEQRATEVGTLLALGWTPGQVRRLLLAEGGALALAGGLAGMWGGTGYARLMLLGLSGIWRDAVQTSALRYHAEPGTLALGGVAAVLVAWLTLGFALRRQARQPARELLAEGALETGPPGDERRARGRVARIVAIVTGLGALAWVGWALGRGATADSETFFGAGSLLLIAGLAFAAALVSSLGRDQAGPAVKITVAGLGIRNCARRRKRSLATLGLLACGSFLIASIGVFRLDAVKDARRRTSGTGGFALIGNSTIPVVQDLNTRAGREFFGLDELTNVSFVPIRVREGDEASCLNLNRAQQPRLLGVDPGLLADRGAFTFSRVADGGDAGNPWLRLERARAGDVGSPRPAARGEADAGTDVVPAIGDEASIVWAMGKKVGDTLDYTDQQGRPFKVRIVAALANSILQGNLIIAEDEFVARYPSESGYRMYLIDAPWQDAEGISAALSRALRDWGLEVMPAARRLAGFNAVQNTYLSTFQVLGGLGLLLGSIGLGVVVMRNVLERRGELALLLALGFRPRVLRWLVLSEHGLLLAGGLCVGMLAALVAVLPSVLSPGTEVPYVSLAVTLGGVFVSGFLWTWLAAVLALRGRLLDALRNE